VEYLASQNMTITTECIATLKKVNVYYHITITNFCNTIITSLDITAAFILKNIAICSNSCRLSVSKARGGYACGLEGKGAVAPPSLPPSLY